MESSLFLTQWEQGAYLIKIVPARLWCDIFFGSSVVSQAGAASYNIIHVTLTLRDDWYPAYYKKEIEVVPFAALNILCMVSCDHELCYFKTRAMVIQKRNFQGNLKELKWPMLGVGHVTLPGCWAHQAFLSSRNRHLLFPWKQQQNR